MLAILLALLNRFPRLAFGRIWRIFLRMTLTLPESLEARLSPQSTALHLAIGLFVAEEATLGQAAQVAGCRRQDFFANLAGAGYRSTTDTRSWPQTWKPLNRSPADDCRLRHVSAHFLQLIDAQASKNGGWGAERPHFHCRECTTISSDVHRIRSGPAEWISVSAPES